MLNRVINLALCLILFFASCYDNNQKKGQYKDITKVYKRTSLLVISKNEYDKIYVSTNDSLKHWIDNNLASYIDCKLNKWEIDSLICFNSKADKFITALYNQKTYHDNTIADDMNFFYGTKIKGKWYFFRGPNIVLPREYYQKDITTPMSFSKMHEIAIDEIFSGYLKKDIWGNLEINDRFFNDLTSVAWCINCKTQAQWDSAYLKIVNENWAKRDTAQSE